MKPVADLAILMPTFNHARYLRRALNAIVEQSVLPKEIIVVDDCSPDETPAILAEYARNHSMIRVIRNDQNQGVNRTINRALEASTAAYVFSTASDDYILPGFIEKSMEMLNRYPQASQCCCYLSTVDDVSGEIQPNASQWCESPRYFSPSETEVLLGRGTIAGHTAILKRQAAIEAGFYLPQLEWHADVFLSTIIALRYGICHIPETLALLTVMPGTYSTGVQQTERQKQVLNALIDQLIAPEHRDVALAIRRSGCLRHYGPRLIHAAANRPDVHSPEILSFLNCLPPDDYRQMLDDSDSAVRVLAKRLLAPEDSGVDWVPRWHRREREHYIQVQHAYIKDLETQLQASQRTSVQSVQFLEETIAAYSRQLVHLEATLERMKSTRLWKLRLLAGRCKRAVFRLLKPNKVGDQA